MGISKPRFSTDGSSTARLWRSVPATCLNKNSPAAHPPYKCAAGSLDRSHTARDRARRAAIARSHLGDFKAGLAIALTGRSRSRHERKFPSTLAAPFAISDDDQAMIELRPY